MRFADLATLLALTGVAIAQSGPVDPRTVPACVRACSVKAAAAAGCKSPLDLKCVCNNNTYTSTALNCILADSTCSGQLGTAAGISGRLCTAPPDGGVACPTDDGSWAMCGDICIDKSAQTCASGTPVNNAVTRRSVTFCEPHQRMCKVGQLFGVNQEAGFGYECLDVYNNLEACGGCPGDGGVDCTALYGVVDVACRRGKCHIEECEEGLNLIHGRCK